MRYTCTLAAALAILLATTLTTSSAATSDAADNPILADKYSFTGVTISESYKTNARQEVLYSRMAYIEYEVQITERGPTGNGSEYEMAGVIAVAKIFDDTSVTTEQLLQGTCDGRIDFVATHDSQRKPAIEISATCRGVAIPVNSFITMTVASLIEPASDFQALVDKSANGTSIDGSTLKVIESDRRVSRNERYRTGGFTERRWVMSEPDPDGTRTLTTVSKYQYPSTTNSRVSVALRIIGRATD